MVGVDVDVLPARQLDDDNGVLPSAALTFSPFFRWLIHAENIVCHSCPSSARSSPADVDDYYRGGGEHHGADYDELFDKGVA